MAYTIMFYAVSALILASAAAVALSRNIIYSAFALLFAFMGVGMIYAMLSADFLAIGSVAVCRVLPDEIELYGSKP